ncbi:MAG: 5-formyltetrahydrofolate cyclo-ligase [Desulfurococcaceae archaeon]
MSSEIDVKQVKARIRETIWRLLEESNVAEFPRPVYGRIPNFKGADEAARRLFKLKVWSSAQVIKSNPDSPQYYVRLQALREGKLLVMASPRLRSGFLLIDPRKVPPSKYVYAATIKGAFIYGRRVRLSEIPPVDLVIAGCVAVNEKGARLGKGGGYSELEYGILREAGLITDSTPIATTVHDLQLIKDDIPLEIHDLTVDYIATPSKIVEIKPRGYKPRGIYWELLTPELRELEVIKELMRFKTRTSSDKRT